MTLGAPALAFPSGARRPRAPPRRRLPGGRPGGGLARGPGPPRGCCGRGRRGQGCGRPEAGGSCFRADRFLAKQAPEEPPVRGCRKEPCPREARPVGGCPAGPGARCPPASPRGRGRHPRRAGTCLPAEPAGSVRAAAAPAPCLRGRPRRVGGWAARRPLTGSSGSVMSAAPAAGVPC